jgi:hypothetical protein
LHCDGGLAWDYEMPARPSPAPAPAECAQCGGDIPRRAKACPHCGADERTGWREQSVYDGMELPDEAWADNSETPARAENKQGDERAKAGMPWYWTAVALTLLLMAILFATGTW